ncbi:hypothetical protein R1flu_002770 [Riccia fluitans]|uniref:Uncharacterized protein n=1 Tax=Riccia fluitans TaxID=41844 RepID=A0ABD1Y7K9_9MARC
MTRYDLHEKRVANEPSPWRLCPVSQVEELKSIIRLVPLWETGLMTGLSMAQASTYMIQQARTMNRSIGGFDIPPASIRKIGIGYGLHLVAMAISIPVEHERRVTAGKHGFIDKPHEVLPFSAFTLVPQEMIDGIAGFFALTGHMKFYYHMVPEHVTSTASALGQTSLALGTLLASALLNALQSVTESPGHPGWLDDNLNKAHRDYFYSVILFLQLINFTVYVCFVSKWYRKQLIGN